MISCAPSEVSGDLLLLHGGLGYNEESHKFNSESASPPKTPHLIIYNEFANSGADCYSKCLTTISRVHTKYFNNLTEFLSGRLILTANPDTIAKYRKLWTLECDIEQLFRSKSEENLNELYPYIGSRIPEIRDVYTEYLNSVCSASASLIKNSSHRKCNSDITHSEYSARDIVINLYAPAVWVLILLEIVEWSQFRIEADPILHSYNETLKELIKILTTLDYRLYLRQRAVLLGVLSENSPNDSNREMKSSQIVGYSPKTPPSSFLTLKNTLVDTKEKLSGDKGSWDPLRLATSKVSETFPITNPKPKSIFYTLEKRYGTLIHSDESLIEVPDRFIKLLYKKTVSAIVSFIGLSTFKPVHPAQLYLHRNVLVILRKKSRDRYNKTECFKSVLILFLNPDKTLFESDVESGSLVVVDYVRGNSSGSLFYIIYVDSSRICHTITFNAVSRAACVDCVNSIHSQFPRFSQFLNYPPNNIGFCHSPISPTSSTFTKNSEGINGLDCVVLKRRAESTKKPANTSQNLLIDSPSPSELPDLIP